MRIITFQHEEVVRILKKYGVYMCSYISEFHKSTPKSYKFLRERFKQRYPNELITYPIYGWSQVFRDEFPIDETNPETISRMLGMTGMLDTYYMLVLDVPENKVMETDFYGFVDLRFCEEFPDEGLHLSPEIIESIVTPRKNNTIEIQAIMGRIDIDWVIKILPLRELLNK